MSMSRCVDYKKRRFSVHIILLKIFVQGSPETNEQEPSFFVQRERSTPEQSQNQVFSYKGSEALLSKNSFTEFCTEKSFSLTSFSLTINTHN